MDYAGMAQRLGQFRQAQVPGGGQRPMTQGGPMGGLQGMGQKIQGLMPQGLPQWNGLSGSGSLQPQTGGMMQRPPMGQMNPMAMYKNRMGGGSM